MEKRTFEWDGDFEACRAEADAGKFDTELAEFVGKRMYQAYRLERLVDKPFKVGWSICTSETFDMLWTQNNKVKHLSEHEAKVLFLAASDVFHKLEFGGRTALEKREDLKARMSRLCEMVVEITNVSEKVVDYDSDKYESRWDKVKELEEVYQTLFSETLRIYGS
ncbi:MAG: hypothetical protein OXH00_21610 [Candidatus Poribacteria bacterium]|nr:hypothetical protein [Candidatus Poribacteria bacterium]